MGINQVLTVGTREVLDRHAPFRVFPALLDGLAISPPPFLDGQGSREDAWRRIRQIGCPVRENVRGYQPPVGNGESARDDHRCQELEHRERLHVHIHRHRHDQQVGGCTDRRPHTPNEGGKTHGHENARGGGTGFYGHAGQDRQQQNHDGHIVHKCPQGSTHHQRQEKGTLRRKFPQPGQQASHRFQCPGAGQAVTDHHERGDSDQGFMAEPEKEILRMHRDTVMRIRKQLKTRRQHDQHKQAGRVQGTRSRVNRISATRVISSTAAQWGLRFSSASVNG